MSHGVEAACKRLASHAEAARKLLSALGVDPKGVRSFVVTGGLDRVITVHVERTARVDGGAKLAEAAAALEGCDPLVIETRDRLDVTPAWPVRRVP